MQSVRKEIDYTLLLGWGLIIFGVLGMAWVFGLI